MHKLGQHNILDPHDPDPVMPLGWHLRDYTPAQLLDLEAHARTLGPRKPWFVDDLQTRVREINAHKFYRPDGIWLRPLYLPWLREDWLRAYERDVGAIHA